MKKIIKNPEPVELIEYKKTPGVSFDGWPKEVRDPVKKSLVEEQGYICCYCQQYIDVFPNTIIEHFLPRNGKGYDHLSLEYTNLLASCDGGQGERSLRDDKGRKKNKKYPVHCDASKENEKIGISPLREDCERFFLYDDDGNIFPKDSDELSDDYLMAEETIRILNLNNNVLSQLRKAAFDGFLDHTYEQLSSVIDALNEKNNSKFYAFAGAIICYIKYVRLPFMTA